MTKALKQVNGDHVTSYEGALQSAIDELQQLAEDSQKLREEMSRNERRSRELEKTVNGLLSLLPPNKAAKYEDIVGRKKAQPISNDPRASEIFNNVVSLVFGEPEKEWNSATIIGEFEKHDAPVDPKAILNVLNYLQKKGRLERVARGRYRVPSGALFITGHDFEGYD